MKHIAFIAALFGIALGGADAYVNQPIITYAAEEHYLDQIQFDTQTTFSKGEPEDFSFLINEANNANSACAVVQDRADDGHIAAFQDGVTIEALDEVDVRAAIAERIGEGRVDALLTSVKRLYGEWPEYRLRYVCQADDETVVAGRHEFDFVDVHAAEWQESQDGMFVTLDRFQPVNSVAPFDYIVYRSADTDRFVVHSLYGDAGVVWWAFTALDADSLTSDLLEECRMHDDTASGDFSEMTCARQYVP